MTDDRTEERQRAQRRAVREYRRQGYDVLERPRGDMLPSFLRGFAPDLVVIKDDDHAVVEIKTREEIVGSNEFAELAKAIDAKPDWRLELISLGRRKPVIVGLAEDELERLLATAWAMFDSGQRDAALIYLVSLLDEFVHDAAIRHRVRGLDRAVPAIIHELSFMGVISETTADVLDDAWKRRDAIVHGHTQAKAPSKPEIARLVSACREVQVAMRLETA
jgi:REase_AHJR-like